MTLRRTRPVAALGLALALAAAVPAAAVAASPEPGAPPADVQDWQEHLDHMRAMGSDPGSHISDCVAMHGSMAGLLGPNGMMVQGMAGMMGGEGRP